MSDQQLTPATRKALRASLATHVPWLTHTELGPQAVDAGTCDRCDVSPRLVPTCGPVAWPALCRGCAAEVGLDAWCDGHEEDGAEALRWAAALPAWWADAVILWWVATGELAWDGAVPRRVPLDVQRHLHGGAADH